MSTRVLPGIKARQVGEDHIVVKFTGFNSNILLQEEYCVNPGCSCSDGVLTFIELSEEGKMLNPWFSIRLDMRTWEVTEKKVFNKMIKVDMLIKEFMDSIDIIKERLFAHFVKAKECGRRHFDYIGDDIVKLILDGEMLPYAEVLGDKDTGKFYFEIDRSESWFFDDNYCTKPQCRCNEVVLTFFKIDESRKTQEPEFAVRMNMKNFKYDVEFNNCSVSRIGEVINHLHNIRPEVFDLFKIRAGEMKDAAREVIKKFSSEVKREERSNAKVGRNDPCPCGSGKKYKKCCGSK